jgi:hypothetical protein
MMNSVWRRTALGPPQLRTSLGRRTLGSSAFSSVAIWPATKTKSLQVIAGTKNEPTGTGTSFG